MAFDVAAYKKAWVAANPDKVRAYSTNRVLTPEQKARRLETERLRRANAPPRPKIPTTAEQKAKNSEKAKRWREANAERAREQDKAKYETNKAKCLAAQKKWRAGRDAEALQKKRERNGVWVSANKDKMRAYKAAWKDDNRGACAADAMRRHVRKINAMPKWLTLEDHAAMDVLYDLAQASGMQVDHIYPLRGKTVCGLHVPGNLQLLTPFENQSKGNRMPVFDGPTEGATKIISNATLIYVDVD